VDLLFATLKVQNNEISLPQSIAELLRDEKARPGSNSPGEDVMRLHDQVFSPTASMKSRIPASIDLPSRAAAGVDLTGRWRPSKTISNQDLVDYNEFLKACCSDQLSYWTRQLLSSYSVVSRQEFVVKQFDEGNSLEFVDIHPLSSNVWNRTIITNGSPSNNRLGTNSSSNATNCDSKFDGSRAYVNELKGPQGEPVLVEAYWEENGTVHTSLLRKVLDDDREDDSENQGWLQTRRYLFPGTNDFETQQGEEDQKVMLVETTYYSTSYTAETDCWFNSHQRKDESSTKMVWRWEQMDDSSS